jgi:hypothetical protein
MSALMIRSRSGDLETDPPIYLHPPAEEQRAATAIHAVLH